jgi:hypothetical protein
MYMQSLSFLSPVLSPSPPALLPCFPNYIPGQDTIHKHRQSYSIDLKSPKIDMPALAKYRARRAYAKELASSREELELEYRKLANPHPPSYDDIFGDSQSQASAGPMATGINDDSVSHSNSTRRSGIEIARLPSTEGSREASKTSLQGISQGRWAAQPI